MSQPVMASAKRAEAIEGKVALYASDERRLVSRMEFREACDLKCSFKIIKSCGSRFWASLSGAARRFLGDRRVCLTNNAAERALRGVAIGRRGWTFAVQMPAAIVPRPSIP